MSDYERVDSNGRKDWDWKAYHAARIENGEKCTVCGTTILFPEGKRRRCDQCQDVDGNGELVHNHFIRCPECGYTEDPFISGILEHDCEDAEVVCEGCGHDYTVGVRIQYTFTSPARILSPEVEDAENEDEEEADS